MALREAMIEDARNLSRQDNSRNLQVDDISEQTGTAMGAIFLDCTFQVSFRMIEFENSLEVKILFFESVVFNFAEK